MISFISKNEKQTRRIAERLGQSLLGQRTRKALTIGLKGDLGGGKTTFIKGLAKSLSVRERMLSPTFIILRAFEISKQPNFKEFYHLDCYRLKDGRDLLELGLNDIFNNPENIVAIEWVDRIKDIRPRIDIRIEFKWLDKNKRLIRIYGADRVLKNK